MDGILYAFDLTGKALRQANAEVERLTAEVSRLQGELAELQPEG